MKRLYFPTLVLMMVTLASCDEPSPHKLPSIKELEASFNSPPETARPWTWWHWIDGNVTRAGITSDLEAMQRAGLGAALIFNVKLGLPDGPARFMSDRWLGLLDHAAAECDRLGLKLGIHNCDGWSQAGGPWIMPELSMKKLVWSKVQVEGPIRFSGTLPRPAIPESPLVNGFYRDVAILAYPTPQGERVNGPAARMTVDGSLQRGELRKLFDDDLSTHALFPKGTQVQPAEHTVVMSFEHPVAARNLVIRGTEGYALADVIPGMLEMSADGVAYRRVATFELNWSLEGSPQPSITVAFPEVRGRVYRLRFKGEHITATTSADLSIAEIELGTSPALHYWEAKTGWTRVREHGGEAPFLARDPGPGPTELNLPADGVIPLDKVKVFRREPGDEGRFEWEVPGGSWTLLRVGYTSTGRTNSPATDEGRGLEADKLDAEAVRFHMEQFIGKLTDRYGERNLRSFQIFETDSWESGAQTWTRDLDQRFMESTGQDLLKWLPLILEGVLVEGYDESDRLLWDWRRFLADEIAGNYYRVTADFAAEKGLTYVSEASGRQMFMYDPIGYQRISPVPMGEFWFHKARGQGVRVDNKVAASAAHLTGRKLVASESYTSPSITSRWTQHPFTLKSLGDEAFCLGVNKYIFHTYAHQPYPELKPGFAMGIWGMHNHNGNTWWDGPVEAWFDYITRCQYLLQEGRFHADILAYLGEEVPARLGRRNEFKPAIPSGYDFDACDFQALLDAEVEDGEIVLPGGMHYKVLLLPDKKSMRVAVVERIAALADAGAIIVGPVKPAASPSLEEMDAGDRKVREIVHKYWDEDEKIHLATDSLEDLLTGLGIPPDFSYTGSRDEKILYIHRLVDDADLYFLSNQQDRVAGLKARFRQSAAREVSLWDPANGKKYRAGEPEALEGGVSGLDLTLDPYGSVFVVFSHVRLDLEPAIRTVDEIALDGPWELRFPAGKGAPSEPLENVQLGDWTKQDDFGVRHFSGTGHYRTSLQLEGSYLAKGDRILIDLGEVREMAGVIINGQSAGYLWKPPFRTDITPFLKEGVNRIEVKITNVWANRLIGDAYFPEEMEWYDFHGVRLPERWPEWLKNGELRPASKRVAWTTRGGIYHRTDPLLPAGLLGPVKLIVAKTLDN
jgi:hypothetical protein